MQAITKFSLIFFAVIAFAVSSCKKDDNEDPNDPGADSRDQFVASWTCQATSNNFGVTTYTITIKKDTTNSSNIKIYNFDNLGTSIAAYASVNSNTITIPQQSVLGNGVQGSGSLQSATKLLYTYTIDDGITVDTVSADCTKQ